MTLKVPGKWIWDFWFAQDNQDYHIFYLQADNSLKDQVLRHWNVSIGHAVSQNLVNWEILPDALHPGSSESWDDKTTWTGSIIKHNDRWYMFYTGSQRADKGLIQRIGLATSADLITWKKHPENPLIEADPQWYELLNQDFWHDQAWRDPYIYYDDTENIFHAFITARLNIGIPDGRGVIAHATSPDLIDWTVKEPITPPGEFGHMEVPQILHINGRYYLVFCCPASEYSKSRTNRLREALHTGTFYMTSDQLDGPYTYDTEGTIFADAQESLYSGKLIQAPDKSWVFMAFRNFDSNGLFIGDIIDPVPVMFDNTGKIIIKP